MTEHIKVTLEELDTSWSLSDVATAHRLIKAYEGFIEVEETRVI